MTERLPTHARRKAERWGRLAEWLCVLRLRLAGWQILSRRMSSHRGTGLGEIDIVARRRRTLVFVEVKARAAAEAAVEAVTSRSRKRIVAAAEIWLAHHPDDAARNIRFDVIVVTPGRIPHHITNAFDATR